jgi:hypothetical protein
MLNNITSVTTGPVVRLADQVLSIQVWGSVSAGTGSATVKFWGTNNMNAPWVPVATVDLALTTTVAGEGTVIECSWDFVRADVTAISGTGASVSAAINSNKWEG